MKNMRAAQRAADAPFAVKESKRGKKTRTR
jgi:hypothetical protein